MVLLLDSGNTRLKWALLDVVSIIPGGGVSWRSVNCFEPLSKLVKEHAIKQVAVANVAGEKRADVIAQWAAEHDLLVRFYKAEPSCFGVRNGYQQAERLGVDRWLAMLAATFDAAGEACCVVDCGSAITIDVVDGRGVHQGGSISPGLAVMMRALATETSLQSVEPQLVVNDWARETKAAIRLGCHLSAIGLIAQGLKRFHEEYGKSARVYLTGGDAEVLRPHLPSSVVGDPWLVMKGLVMVHQGRKEPLSIALRSP